jgi:UDP-N-acetylmuramoyl-tripeptide--D-alanyl-D-alanine ligase
MMESSMTKAAVTMHGLLQGSDVQFRGVSTDTRTIESGELFVALSGPNFDGSEFLKAAEDRQAAGAVTSNSAAATTLPKITVADSKLALGCLASSWRQEMSASVIGITGSNGKTTLKELIASCLSQSAETLATHGNLNNDIGLPLMLLKLSPEHRYAVIEMGANHAGEIEYLTSLAAPSVVAITNAGPAHLEGFGTIEGVAKAKGEILQSANRPRAAILNADDEWFDYWTSLVNDLQLISFGLSANAAVNASDISIRSDGSTFQLHMPNDVLRIKLPLQGVHNVRNACAAAAVSLAFKLSAQQIKTGLETVAPVAGRLQAIPGIRGSRILDDSYNSNPASAIAAAEFLVTREGSSVLVLADMRELGEDSVSLHQAVGRAAREAGVDRLLATGELSKHTVSAFGNGATWYESADEISADLCGSLDAGNNVLVKGSRSMHMGRVVRAIQLAPKEKEAS